LGLFCDFAPTARAALRENSVIRCRGGVLRELTGLELRAIDRSIGDYRACRSAAARACAIKAILRDRICARMPRTPGRTSCAVSSIVAHVGNWTEEGSTGYKSKERKAEERRGECISLRARWCTKYVIEYGGTTCFHFTRRSLIKSLLALLSLYSLPFQSVAGEPRPRNRSFSQMGIGAKGRFPPEIEFDSA